jgi:NitT/TauT family transport system substrate-binding protein
VARFDRLKIGAPDLPDALPIKLGVFRPIFKENRLNVDIVPFKGETEGKRILKEASVDGIICDLPTGLALTREGSPVRIVKNVLRANPFRALFAIVAGPKDPVRDLAQLEGRVLAVPRGISFRFYMEFYLKGAGLSLDKIVLKEVETLQDAWELLNKGEVSAAVLRTPYTDMAMARKLPFLADDRSLPWMSVLILKKAVIDEKFEVIKRFIFGLEQSVLALNLKPDEFRALLEEQGGIPKEIRKSFPVPIFEGANAPSPDEIETILEWLDRKGLISKETPYDKLVNANFLPDPNDVGLAFCCR